MWEKMWGKNALQTPIDILQQMGDKSPCNLPAVMS